MRISGFASHPGISALWKIQTALETALSSFFWRNQCSCLTYVPLTAAIFRSVYNVGNGWNAQHVFNTDLPDSVWEVKIKHRHSGELCGAAAAVFILQRAVFQQNLFFCKPVSWEMFAALISAAHLLSTLERFILRYMIPNTIVNFLTLLNTKY